MRVMELRNEWSPDDIVPGERPDPEPGPGEVLLRMRAASLNYRDFVMANRGYGRRSGWRAMSGKSNRPGSLSRGRPLQSDEIELWQKITDGVCQGYDSPLKRMVKKAFNGSPIFDVTAKKTL